jgi:ribosome-binding factor A
MREIKKEKVAEIIRQKAADFVLREATPASLITVTRVEMNPAGKLANIYFTTLPEDKEDTALKFLERKGGELHMYVRDHSKIGMMPELRWKIDYGERNRQRLDELSTG